METAVARSAGAVPGRAALGTGARASSGAICVKVRRCVVQGRRMAKLALVGAGMMGSALCVPLADAGHEGHLIGTPLDEEIVRALEAGQPHPKLGLRLPSSVTAHPVARLASACEGADGVILGVSSAGVRWAASSLGPILQREPVPVLLLSKGLELGSAGLRVLTQSFAESLPDPIRD